MCNTFKQLGQNFGPDLDPNQECSQRIYHVDAHLIKCRIKSILASNLTLQIGNYKGPDQTAQMHRLVCTFVVCKSGYLASRPIMMKHGLPGLCLAMPLKIVDGIADSKNHASYNQNDTGQCLWSKGNDSNQTIDHSSRQNFRKKIRVW